MAAEEAISESGIGSKGDFPGPLFLAVPPIEMEWPQRRALAEASGATTRSAMPICCVRPRRRQFSPYHQRFLFGFGGRRASPTGSAPKARRYRFRPLAASGATAIQLGNRGDPARRDQRCGFASAPTARLIRNR